MRTIQDLKVEARSGTGKGAAFRTRQNGNVPGILYGGGESEQVPVQISLRELERHTGTGTFLTTLFMLELDGKKTRVIPREVQLDPVTDRPVHVDFMRLPKGAVITLAIPVRFKGQENSPGLKRGGVLNIVRHEVEMHCPAENIPEYIEGDLSELDIHDSLHISAFKLPEGVKPTIKRDFTVASIVAPTSVIEEQRAAAAAAAAAALAPETEEPVEGEAAPGAEPAAEGAAAPAAGAAAGAAKAPEKK